MIYLATGLMSLTLADQGISSSRFLGNKLTTSTDITGGRKLGSTNVLRTRSRKLGSTGTASVVLTKARIAVALIVIILGALIAALPLVCVEFEVWDPESPYNLCRWVKNYWNIILYAKRLKDVKLPKKNYYDILGFTRESLSAMTDSKIRSVYRNITKTAHPDKHPLANEKEKADIEAKWRALVEAKDALKDEYSRRIYDKKYEDDYTMWKAVLWFKIALLYVPIFLYLVRSLLYFFRDIMNVSVVWFFDFVASLLSFLFAIFLALNGEIVIFLNRAFF